MRIFISYSTGDLEIVKQIAETLQQSTEVFYWDKDHEPGKEVWKTIFKWIDSADLVICVITKITVKRAMSVGQEIGRAQAKNKKIIPLVHKGIPTSELGCLHGITYVPFSKDNIEESLVILQEVVGVPELDEVDEIDKEWQQIKRILLIVGGLLVLLYLMSADSKSKNYWY